MIDIPLGDVIRSCDDDSLALLFRTITEEGDVDLVREDMVSQITGYRLDTVIGTGGMGTVWRAEQLSTKRSVALKVQKSRLGFGRGLYDSDPQGVQSKASKLTAQFEQEVVLAASLTHPQIVRVYESGYQDGFHYFAMELVDGQPLHKYLADHPDWSDHDAAKLILHLCEPLSYAHHCGVIHHDLKPSNVLMGNDGLLRIADFGLATRYENGVPNTGEASVGGTPEFMAPEQLDPDRAATPATDIYGLGAILFFVLTGKPPLSYHRDRDDLTTLATRQRRSVRDHTSHISDEIAAIVTKCLSLSPELRYQRVEELAGDLRRFGTNRPVLAYKTNVLYRATKGIKRWQRFLVLAGVLLFALLAAGVAVRHQIQTTQLDSKKHQQLAHTTKIANQLGLAQLAIKERRYADASNSLVKIPDEDREWEWGYLMGLLDKSDSTFSVLGRRAAAISVSQEDANGTPNIFVLTPDGEIIKGYREEKLETSATAIGFPGQWSVKSPSPVSGTGKACAISQDGRIIVFRNGVAGLAVYREGAFNLQILDHSSEFADTGADLRIAQTQVSSDGQQMGYVLQDSNSRSDEIVVVDLTSQHLQSRHYPIEGPIQSFGFSPEGSVIYVAANELVKINLSSEQFVTVAKDVYLKKMVASNSGQALAGINNENELMVLNTTSGMAEFRLPLRTNHPTMLAWSENDKHLIVGHDDGSLFVVDRVSQTMSELHGHTTAIAAAGFWGDSSLAFAITGEGLGKTWRLFKPDDHNKQDGDSADTSSLAAARLLQQVDNGVTFHFDINPQSDWMAWSSDAATVKTWRPEDGVHPQVLHVPDRRISSIDISDAGQLLALAYSEGSIEVYARNMVRKNLFNVPSIQSPRVAWSDDGSRLAVTQWANAQATTIYENFQPRNAEKNHQGQAVEILQTLPAMGPTVWLPGARFFFAPHVDQPNVVMQWDVTNKTAPEPILDMGGAVVAMAIDRDGDFLAAINPSGECVVYDLGDRKELHRTQPGNRELCISLAFSHNSNRIAVAGSDIHILDTRTGTVMLSFELGLKGAAYRQLNFLEDSRWLLATGFDRPRILDGQKSD